jgi:RNA polymerase sigma factor (sigma-70 family)
LSRSVESVFPIARADAQRLGLEESAREHEARLDQVFSLVYRQMSSLLATSDRAELDDLAQIAAEQAVRALPRFRGGSALGTWTYRICYSTLLKHQRFWGRWRRRFRLTHRGELPEPPAEQTTVPEALEAFERIERLRRAVAELPPKRRAAVVLHDLEGLELTEIAVIVGSGIATVKTRLRDGRRMLARVLRNDPYFGDLACRRTPREGTPDDSE